MRLRSLSKRTGLLLFCVGAMWCMPGCGGSPSAGTPSGTGPLTSITITLANPTIAVGTTDQFTATGTYSNGSTQTLTGQVTWSSLNTAIVTINASGMASGVAAGTATIQASLSGVNGSIQVTVTTATLQSIAVTAAGPSIVQGLTDQFTATGTYSNGSTQNLTSQVTWSSLNTAVVTINTSGLATGVAVGSTTIQASLGGVQGSAQLMVTAATLQSIAVTATSLSIAPGATDQFTATGTYSNGSTQNLTTQVTWSSSNTAVATINTSGLATGVAVGSTTIQASLSGVSGSALLSVVTSSGFAGVLTQHNDNGRTGQNLNETILTPSNVNSTTFGKLFSMPVDGYVYAQPLYVSNVSISGGTHNVLYVATEGDSVYAFDADTGAQLWHVSLIDTAHGATSGETTVSISQLQAGLGDSGCTDLMPQVGITSTPVIDSSTSTMYVETKSAKSNGNIVHRLHMISTATGAEISPGPAGISATVSGTSDGGTTITFDGLHHLNRPGLLLANGQVYLGYASHCDDTPYHGWIFAYNASTLAQTAVFITTPNGQGAGGIWMSGAGIAADSSGNIFAPTGNGNYDATDEGDSVLKLNGSTLTLTDYFTPFDQGNDQLNDLDVASGGILLLPTQSGTFPDELIQGTKDGSIYLINRDQMTTNNQHYCAGCTSDPEIVQEILNAGNVVWLYAAPTYFNNMVYFWGSNDVLKAYTLTSGRLSASPSSSSTITFAFPGATPSISANGTTNGILWAIDSSQYGNPGPGPGPAVLHAINPSNVAHEYYNSTQAGSRDRAGNAVKFAVPSIANGKVYLGTQTEIDVYGLCPSSGCP